VWPSAVSVFHGTAVSVGSKSRLGMGMSTMAKAVSGCDRRRKGSRKPVNAQDKTPRGEVPTDRDVAEC
jgi:hypothetical protein